MTDRKAIVTDGRKRGGTKQSKTTRVSNAKKAKASTDTPSTNTAEKPTDAVETSTTTPETPTDTPEVQKEAVVIAKAKKPTERNKQYHSKRGKPVANSVVKLRTNTTEETRAAKEKALRRTLRSGS